MDNTNKTKKQKIKSAILFFLKFSGLFLASFFFLFAILNVLYEFNLISAAVLLFVPLIVSFLFAVVFLIVLYINKKRKIKALQMFKKINFSRIGIIVFLLFLFAQAIKSKIYFTQDLMISFLALQWGIFAISVAIFGIWATSIINRKNELLYGIEKCDSFDKVSKLIHIQTDRDMFISVNFSIILLICNLVALSTSSSMFYIVSNGEINLITQSMAIFSCYMCTNSLVSIFMDVLIPVWFLRKAVKIKYDSTDVDKITNELLKKELGKQAKKLENILEIVEKGKITNGEVNIDQKKTSKRKSNK